MVKLIAVYRRPDDIEAFERHYREVHAPLARSMPGLQRLEVNRVYGIPGGGDSDVYLIAEMLFSSREALEAALASPEGRAAGKDLISFARGIVSLYLAEVEA
ncbi:EthD family reductase [Hydrogenibacillus sp. N12]|uniref:EthD family reductase n=1 Tax=Hydrogenibacillus schlegelii TaxID=1484 RepID=A0A947CW90_HYDSH|nr:EthD family reductase [Hydrogenibacillus sp. N12]MBT9281885.1 EthD family reductase [Hydrogenibacillus schlegelii]QZA31972.1 EthD family reductase [Hydrogenibacillus sp. N12]